MDVVGGYRLVRQLGSGPRAEVYLARGDADDESEANVVVKHYRPEVTSASVSTEIEALARGVGEHTVALLDVATAPSGQYGLILARLSGGSLSRLLSRRSSLALGEVVGILRPMVLAVASLHLAGVVHGAIRPDAVLFDGDGIPVLACFGRAALIRPGLPPAMLELETGVEQDRTALAELATTVLERAEDAGAVQPLLDILDSRPADWQEHLAQHLELLAPPEAIDLRASDFPAAHSVIPARIAVAQIPAPQRRRRDARAEATGRRAATTSAGAAAELLAGVVDRERVAAVLGSLRRVRARVWVPAAAVLSALVVALVLIPAMDGAPQAETVRTQSPGVGSPTPAPQTPDASAAEDPVDALVRLLRERATCLEQRSVLCLDAIDQQGSAALASDRELVLSLQAGAETPELFAPRADHLAVAETLGDAVLLAVSDGVAGQPTAVLIVRDAGSWLIRDYLDAGSPAP